MQNKIHIELELVLIDLKCLQFLWMMSAFFIKIAKWFSVCKKFASFFSLNEMRNMKRLKVDLSYVIESSMEAFKPTEFEKKVNSVFQSI